MAHLIALPVTAFRKPAVAHVWPAPVVQIADIYGEAARFMRTRANFAATQGDVDLARMYRARSRQFDESAYRIKRNMVIAESLQARTLAIETFEMTEGSVA